MREFFEFRIPETHASRWLAPTDGAALGIARKLEISGDDERMNVVRHADRQLKSEGRAFFTAWKVDRHYSDRELEAAKVLHLKVTSVFEPAGEVCGTQYDESVACKRCGSGAKQLGPLFLDVNKIPKGKDVARTIAGEIVISRRASDLLVQHGIVGAEPHPVRTKGATSPVCPNWSQLVVQSTEANIVAPTRAGNDPFDEDPNNKFRCPKGHVIGLNVLSEISISSGSFGEFDIVASRQFLGMRRGVLRPERELLISPRLWRLIDSEKLKGCKVEVAHVV